MGAPPAPFAMGAPPPYVTGAPQSDPLSLLRMIVANPQVLQALQPPTPATPRAISLPMPAGPAGSQPLSLPLGAVLNAIVQLSAQGLDRVNANTREEDPEVPEYLVGEDGEFLVDPASPEARARLVAELFEISERAHVQDRPTSRQHSEWIDSTR
jgi:hypothetical protein